NGKSNSAFAFDGINDYISIGGPREDLATITVCAWIKLASNSPVGTIYSDTSVANHNDFIVAANSDTIRIRADKSGATLGSVQPWSAGSGRWRHLVFAMGATNSVIYLDGVPVVDVAGSGSNVGFHTDVWIGAEYYHTGRDYFRGALDEIRIYNRALSANEVTALYASEAPPPPAITAQPVSQTVSVSSNATFSVTATGTAPLSYQWSKDGIVLLGATNATLTLTNVQPPRIGDYRVVVGNGAGSVTSSVATLNIQGVDAGIWKGLVVYYPFNGNANDESGNGKNPTSVQDGFTSNRFGSTSSAFSFAKSQSNIVVPNDNDLNLNTQTEFTISIWAKRDGNSDFTFILNKGGPGGALKWTLCLGDYRPGVPQHPGKPCLSFHWQPGVVWVVSDGFDWDTGWHNYSVTCNRGQFSFFMDGVLIGRRFNNSPLPPNNEPLRLGRSGDNE
ncbi:MAG: hypothetical protein FJ167_12080, partial [Gammaproteobacteria bacterium]|nr:hypothetical protein [Gammaproteobacteria bacterium]